MDETNAITEPTAKVLFRVLNDDGSAEVETLWAFDLGDDNYKLDNRPFYAYGVSAADIVLAPYDREEGFPTFRKVVEKSGNRTVRVIFDTPIKPGNASDQLLKDLSANGCDYEGANKRYIVINIPQSVKFETIIEQLVKADVQWEYADPTYEDLYA